MAQQKKYNYKKSHDTKEKKREREIKKRETVHLGSRGRKRKRDAGRFHAFRDGERTSEARHVRRGQDLFLFCCCQSPAGKVRITVIPEHILQCAAKGDARGRIDTAIPTGSAKKEIEFGRDTSSSAPRYPRNPRRSRTNRAFGYNGAITPAAIARSGKADRIFPPRETSLSLLNYDSRCCAKNSRRELFFELFEYEGNTRVYAKYIEI